MRLFVFLMFFFSTFAIIFHFVLLAITEYPRSLTRTAGEEAGFMVGKIIISVWSAYLLWG